jgi:hypothetical protein
VLKGISEGDQRRVKGHLELGVRVNRRGTTGVVRKRESLEVGV